MNENRMISWEEAEQILGGSSYNEPIKSSLPEQTRPTEPDNDTDVDDSIQKLLQNDPKLKEINLNNMKVCLAVIFHFFLRLSESFPSILDSGLVI